MEEKDSLMMSFPSIPPNFISLQKLQQLRLEEKEQVKKKKEEEEERERCLKENQNKVLQVTDKSISSSNGFYCNQKKWKNERQIKGGRKELTSLKTVEQAVYSEKSKNKSKEKEISKPTTSNGSYNKKKWHKIRERRKEEVGVVEPVDSKKPKKSKDKEKEENQEKLSKDGSISSKGEGEIMGLGFTSSQEIDLQKEEKKKKRRERNKKMKEERLRKKLDRKQKTLVDENGGDVKKIKSMEVKDQISVNPTVEIVVDDESKKMKVEEAEEINGGHQLWRWKKKKSPFIRNVVATTTVLSNPTVEIVQNFDVLRVVGDDQKRKNRRSMMGMNRGFGGGFGNGRNAKGKSRDNDEKNLMWVKKGETMNSTGGNAVQH